MSKSRAHVIETIGPDLGEIVKVRLQSSSVVYHREGCSKLEDPDMKLPRAVAESEFPRRRPAQCCFPEEYNDLETVEAD